jgi:branched-chain amino acid transport system substrate-binding protein
VCLLAGCTTEPDAEPEPVVGVILAISGPAGYIGQPERDVLAALEADYRDRNIDDLKGLSMEILDSGGDPDQAQALFGQLAGNPGVVAVIGPSTSGESVPIAQRARERGIPLLSLAASKRIVEDEAGQVNPWAFKFAQNDDLAARLLIAQMDASDNTRIGLLYADDGFGTSGEAVVAEEVEAARVQIVYDASFAADLANPEPVVRAALDAGANLDGVLIWGTAPGPALLVRELDAQGFQGQIYLSHGDASPAFIEAAEGAAEGAIIVGSRVLTPSERLDPDDPADQVILTFKDRFGEDASPFGGHARDAFEALVTVILEEDALDGGPEAWRAQVRGDLEALSGFHGVTGTFNFSATDHAGLDLDAFGVYRISQGNFVPVSEGG